MPRQTAEQRHRIEPDATHELMDLLVAFHHPIRRWLTELLASRDRPTSGRSPPARGSRSAR